MRDKSELSRLNSKDISTIEVINNPGVEYDADTHAVIKINLKHKVDGGASELLYLTAKADKTLIRNRCSSLTIPRT